MKQFQIAVTHLLKYAKVTGAANMIRPDGSQPAPMGFTGEALNVPWGVNIDGNDDAWVANMWGLSVTLLAGDDTKGHPAGTKTGDVIHEFKKGSMQLMTDVAIDPAGNVWAANNWNNVNAAMADVNPVLQTSTWGGGTGLTVIYGVAAPVKTPLLGWVRKP